MTKAEDRYLDYVQDGRLRNCSSKEAFLYGYRSAERDNELTWEDMMLIHKCIKYASNYHLSNILYDTEKEFYQEVLKRFNEHRNERYK